MSAIHARLHMLDHYLHPTAFPKPYIAEQYKRLLGEYESKLQWAGVGGGRPGSGVNPKSRVCRIAWLPKDDPFCADMLRLIDHINLHKFGFDLLPDAKQPESIQMTVYSARDGKAHGMKGAEEGGYYNPHIDAHTGDLELGGTGDIRKLSTTLSLNPATDYEGGEFELKHSSFGKRRVDAGQMICFHSLAEHQVHPVTKGIRASLVFWKHGPSFR